MHNIILTRYLLKCLSQAREMGGHIYMRVMDIDYGYVSTIYLAYFGAVFDGVEYSVFQFICMYYVFTSQSITIHLHATYTYV